MTRIHHELAERIRGEMLDLEQLVQRVAKAWPSVGRSTGEQDVYLDSVSLNLHGFYSGLERVFELVVSHVDQSRPSGEISQELHIKSSPKTTYPEVNDPISKMSRGSDQGFGRGLRKHNHSGFKW